MTTPPIGLGPAVSEFSDLVGRTPWPAPEIPGHEVPVDYLGKRAVIDLVRTAGYTGWTTRVTHAKGCFPSVGGKPGPQRDSLAVKLWRGERRAVAVYVQGNSTWDWKILRMWQIGMFPAVIANITTFEEMLL